MTQFTSYTVPVWGSERKLPIETPRKSTGVRVWDRLQNSEGHRFLSTEGIFRTAFLGLPVARVKVKPHKSKHKNEVHPSRETLYHGHRQELLPLAPTSSVASFPQILISKYDEYNRTESSGLKKKQQSFIFILKRGLFLWSSSTWVEYPWLINAWDCGLKYG